MSDAAVGNPPAPPAPVAPKKQRDTTAFDKDVPLQAGLEKVPRPQRGMPVMYYHGGSKSDLGSLAFIRATGMTSHVVDLIIMDEAFGTLRTKEGVHHISDPKVPSDEFSTSGSWDYHPWAVGMKG